MSESVTRVKAGRSEDKDVPGGWFRRRGEKRRLKKQRYAERKAAAHPGAPDKWEGVGKFRWR